MSDASGLTDIVDDASVLLTLFCAFFMMNAVHMNPLKGSFHCQHEFTSEAESGAA